MYQPREVGERLRKLRKERAYSRREIANYIGRSEKYYSDIERGTCGMSVDTLLALADFFGVSMDYLVYGKKSGQREAAEVTDAQIEWAVRQLCDLEHEKRDAVIHMLQLL